MPPLSIPQAANRTVPLEDHARSHEDSVHDHAPFEPWAIGRMAVALLGAAILWFRLHEPLAPASVIGIATLAFAGWPMFKEAFENLLARRMTMELSMTIAILAAAAISEFFTAVVVMLFVLVAEELEHLTVARGRLAIKDLIDFVPREARVRRNGDVLTVPVDSIVAGDTVLVSPGEKVPVDGTVVSGHSYVDQSRITGESMPVEKVEGANVYAGSINQMGALEIRVERVGRDTSYGRIVEAVEHAEQTRAPVQRLADQLAGYLVYFAVGAAILTYVLTRDVRDTISVVIVAGACGIAAGTPLAILGGIGRAARLGSIIKGGVHLETLGRIDTVVLDKTGTLTVGEPAVQAISPAPGIDPQDLLRFAAAAELHSEHPLARAVVSEASKQAVPVPEPDSFCYTIGRGITASVEGRTVLVGNRKLLAEAGIETPIRVDGQIGSDIVVAADRRYLGEIIVADTIRPEARKAIEALHGLKVRTMLLTGDTAAVGRSVAQELGIDEVVSDMLPENKLKTVRELVFRGHAVAMVGDGVNDAPALTAANLGIAMGSGTDIAKESADVVLIGNDLGKLVETLRIARRTRTIIWQNFAGTIGVDALGIALAAFGFLNPLLAAFIHVGSELAFILNSARLLPVGRTSGTPGRR
ncbi:heavy metal translocating P-type ATPase [Microvirga sp. G4-2]|uniref:heavy metal translocating P-type ATPase n=1 Tax=Microvirga sp. G4-2 TaxID=3434467 RepID=UPI00404449F6